MCTLNNNKTTTSELFLCNFCTDFGEFFLHFLFKKALPHGIIKPTKTERFYAAFKVQAGISWSAFVIILYSCLFFVFGCSLSLVLLLLLLLLLLNIICFQKSPFPAILFSLLLNLLPRADKRVAAQEEEEEREAEEKCSISSSFRFCGGFVEE